MGIPYRLYRNTLGSIGIPIGAQGWLKCGSFGAPFFVVPAMSSEWTWPEKPWDDWKQNGEKTQHMDACHRRKERRVFAEAITS